MSSGLMCDCHVPELRWLGSQKACYVFQARDVFGIGQPGLLALLALLLVAALALCAVARLTSCALGSITLKGHHARLALYLPHVSCIGIAY